MLLCKPLILSLFFLTRLRKILRTHSEWWKKTLGDFIPWLEFLIEYGYLIGEEKLLELKGPLTADPNYCDSTLESDVEVDVTDFGFVRVSLKTQTFKSRSCFKIFAYAMAAAPEICYIERIVPIETNNEDAQWSSQSNTLCDFPFFDSGLTGKNQIVSLSDTGIDLKSCYFKDNKYMNFGSGFDLYKRKIVQYVDHADRYDTTKGHGTHVAGTIAGHKSLDGASGSHGYANGVAPDAKLAFVDIGDATDKLDIPYIHDLLDYGYGAGARIHSASWGAADYSYSARSHWVDRYLNDNDSFLMIIAAGNAGPDAYRINSP